jgi:hypothetical protein
MRNSSSFFHSIIQIGIISIIALSLSLNVIGQPYLYITMHGGDGGVNNIYSYGLDGTSINTDVLSGDPDLSGLRSGIIMTDGSLLVCNSETNASKIVQYGNCDANGNRKYLSDFTTTHVSHPYGLISGLDAAAGDDVVWATNQDTLVKLIAYICL